ncbi:MAG: exosome complex RNA-binding protein Csl4 [Candidatus Micrarchaeota archaeon]
MEFSAPGDALGTEEEFIPGEGTYVDGDTIRALIAGAVSIGSDRRVSVRPRHPLPSALSPRMTVLGRVEEIFEPIALVRIAPSETGMTRQSWPDVFGVLHVSRVKPGYARNIKDEIRIGDIIKATVEDIKAGEPSLSTRDRGCGVIKAFCTRCRSPLKLAGSALACESCGNKEGRRLGSPYRE